MSKTKRFVCPAWALWGCLVLTLFVTNTTWGRPAVNWVGLTAEDAVPGQLLVGYREGVSMQAVADVHAQVGAQVLHQYRVVPAQVVELPAQVTLAEAARIYENSAAIEYVEPNYIVHTLQTIPNDMRWGDLWGMTRIDAPLAWDIATGSRDIVVAVIDTGINYNHLDLKDNMWINPDPLPGVNDIHGASWVGGNGQMTSGDPMDDHDHGTHCAGTVGAVGDNALGVVGVVWDVQLAGLKFLTATGGGSIADAISAVEYAVERADQIQILSNSWGGGGFSQTLKNMIIASKNAGQLFVAAAGNDSLNTDEAPMYPAAYKVDNIISVAAINDSGNLAGFSNFGEESVHLGAPGVGIWSTVALGNPQDNNYRSFQGTSMACPHVAGAAALLWSVAPDATWEQIKAAILDGVVPNENLEGRTITGGELNVFEALKNVGGVVTLDLRAYQSDATVTVTVTDYGVPVGDASVDINVQMLIEGGPSERWNTTVTLPRVGSASFAGSFSLTAQTNLVPFPAVHDDELVVAYLDSFDNTIGVSALIDDVPPVLTDLSIDGVQDDRALVRWRTDEPANSRVWVGTALPLDPTSEQGSTTFVDTATVQGGVTGYWHAVELTGLEGETRYYVAALSADFAGNEDTLPADMNSSDPADYENFITRQRRVILFEDWERGPRDWAVSNRDNVLCWELGPPKFGPLNAFSGTNTWGTVLHGNYPPFANATLTGPDIELGEVPHLRVQHWHRIHQSDRGYIEANRGQGWELLATVQGDSEGWTEAGIVLPAPFDFSNTRFRFRLESDHFVEDAGWYVDDLELSNLSPFGVYISTFTVEDPPPGGDGDGFIEPGETFTLVLEAFNNQLITASNLTATVQNVVPGVTLVDGPVVELAFGDVLSGGRVDSGGQLIIEVAEFVSPGTRIPLLVTLEADGQGPWEDVVRLRVSERESVTGTVTDVLDAEPVDGALVSAERVGYPTLTAVTAADGTYQLNGLWPDVTYQVSAVLPGTYSRSASVDRVGGPGVVADFALGRAHAGPDPDTVMFALDQGTSGSTIITLNNTNAPYADAYTFEGAIAYDGAFVDWLEVTPLDGSVAASGSLNLEFVARANALPPMTNTATLRLEGNDVSDEPVEIPVTMQVVSAPWLDVDGWRIDGGMVEDGDPFVEPGETVDIQIDLVNLGGASALGVEGVLTYLGTDNVLVSESNVIWGTVDALTVTSSTTHPRLVVGANVADGTVLPFQLEVEDQMAREWTLTFDITITVRRSILGEVTLCADGTPVEDAKVRVRDLDSGQLRTTTTDAVGAYRMDGLDGFNYSVRVVPPSPYAAPAAENVNFPPGNGNETVNFCVADWGISVNPAALHIAVPEGVTTNALLTVSNTGLQDGSVEFDVQLVSGLVEPASLGTFTPPPVPWDELEPDDYLPQELLVRFEDQTGPATQQQVLDQYGLQTIRTFRRLPAQQVRVADNWDMREVAEQLMAEAAVRYVEPNYRYETQTLPNDDFFDDLWGLRNVRQTGGSFGADINVMPVWSRTTGDTNVIVAVVDTGIDDRHEDLGPNVVDGYDYGMGNADARPDYDVINYSTIIHGTHVAGTIGAVGNNATGITGVAWDVGLMPLKVTTNILVETPIGEVLVAVISSAALVDSVEHIVDNNVPISNHSYGGSLFSGLLYEAFQAAYQHGHVAVAAAGNDWRNNNDMRPRYPASFNLPNIISVAASNPDGEIADFSNIGPNSVHIAAPGVDILSTVMDTTGNFPLYVSMPGTSMAAPHVAGAAALLQAKAPHATWDMIRRALLDGARRDEALQGLVATGHLDVERAMQYLVTPWIAVEPVVLNVPAGGNAAASVLLNVQGNLLAGTYEATLWVQQGVNQIEVPVTLEVEPAPAPQVDEVLVVDDPPGGDGDGFAEPGETVDLSVKLHNAGSAFLINPSGTLSTTSDGVTIEEDQATWPSMPSGDVEPPHAPFLVTFDGTVDGVVMFDLDLTDDHGRTWTLEFSVTVTEQLSIRGVLTDAVTGDPLADVPVEYWGDAIGMVTSGADGEFGIHGLADGDYRLRPLPTAHEIVQPTEVTLAGADATVDFALRAPDAIFEEEISVTLPLRQVVDIDWVWTNAAMADFEFRVHEMPKRKVALISDKEQLADVAPVLRALGFEVSVYNNNYYYAILPHPSFPIFGESRGWYSSDAALLAAYDLVIADLSGPLSGGRLLSEVEQDAFEDYLSRGRHLWLTGRNPISQPDDRRVEALVGAATLDRAPFSADPVTVSNTLTATEFITFSPGEAVHLPAAALDRATPANSAADVLLGTSEAVKAMRVPSGIDSYLTYWGGNRSGTDWSQPGPLQDYFRTLLWEDFAQEVDWLMVDDTTGTLAGENGLNNRITLDTTALQEEVYEARLVVLGNYPGAVARSAHITLATEEPRFEVEASGGVKDWMERRLTGDGGAQSTIFQVIYAGNNGVPDVPQADGTPGGDDVLLALWPSEDLVGRMGVGYAATPNMGRLRQTVALPDGLPSEAPIFLRAWDGASFAAAVAYGDSPVQSLTEEPHGTHIDFIGWTVDQVLGYPGPDARDTNGDGIPDGWYVKFGRDPRIPIGPLTAQAMHAQTLGGTALNRPHKGFVADALLFVLDTENHRVTVWNRETGTLAFQYGQQGTASGQFRKPAGMARHPTLNRFAVADTENNRIQVFSFDAATNTVTHEQSIGTAGSGNGQFAKPRGVAIDILGRIIVADTGNNRVQVFNAAGDYQFQFGSFGATTGLFNQPADVAVDENGLIYVADTGNNRIQRFNGSGQFMLSFGSTGSAAGRFSNPNGIAIGVMGRIFVADTSNHRIQIFDAQRNHLLSVGAFGEGTGQLRFPYGVVPVPDSASLYVMDTRNNRVQLFDTITDVDGNGMDDVWEYLNFGAPGQDPFGDPDEDGLPNIAEFRLQTDPNNPDTSGNGWTDKQAVDGGADPVDPSDVPEFTMKILSMEGAPAVAITWMGVADGVYRIETTDNLADDASWVPLPSSTFTSGVNGVVGYTNLWHGNEGMLFYRPVRVE